MRNKEVFKQVLLIFAAEVLCIGIMLLVYALMHKLTTAVWLGALAGGLVAIGNFLFLSISVTCAADRAAKGGEEAAAKATISIQRNSILRKAALLVIYIILLKSGYFDLLTTILPLVFVQLSIYLTEFLRKGGGISK